MQLDGIGGLGRLAQWLERSPHTREVRGSNPRLPTTDFGVPGPRRNCAEVAERQTRYVQDVVPLRVCGFKSLLRHHPFDSRLPDALAILAQNTRANLLTAHMRSAILFADSPPGPKALRPPSRQSTTATTAPPCKRRPEPRPDSRGGPFHLCGSYTVLPNSRSSLADVRWIIVGLPWGQVCGWRHPSSCRISSDISCSVRVSLALIAPWQAME